MRTLVTGATGFIGKRLIKQLDDAVVLSRDAERAKRELGDKVKCFTWAKPAEEKPPAEAFEGVEAIVHLAGDNIAHGRWTDAKKEKMRTSRVDATERLMEAIGELETMPKVLIAGSAIGWYGHRGDEDITEASTQGEDFHQADVLANICGAWEKAANKHKRKMRTVNLRTGVVLGPEGGALAQVLTPFKLGLGGPLGHGQQWMSWIHIDDLVKLILWARDTEGVSGPLNGTAPQPVTNVDYTKALGSVLGRPTLFAAPQKVLNFALGEMAEALLFSSARIRPTVALEQGFEFKHPEVEAALRDLIKGGAAA